MPSWTTPKTWGAGALTSAELNTHVRDNQDWLKAALLLYGIDSSTVRASLQGARYGVSLYKTSQSVNDATETAIAFAGGTEEFDDAAFHDESTNNQRITIPTTGFYMFLGYVSFGADADGRRQVWFERDGGAAEYNRVSIPANSASFVTQITNTALAPMTAGQYMRLFVQHTAGASLNVDARFQAVRLGI